MTDPADLGLVIYADLASWEGSNGADLHLLVENAEMADTLTDLDFSRSTCLPLDRSSVTSVLRSLGADLDLLSLGDLSAAIPAASLRAAFT